jgi:cobalt-zinc-cadmium efflux system outer membrane protein
MIRALTLLLMIAAASPALGQAEVPAVKLPDMVTLDDALRIFRASGLDLLIAEAAVQSAEGDVRIAHQIYNPNVSYSFSHIFNYNPIDVCPMDPGACSPNVHSLTLGDNAALIDYLVGKRGLRIGVAQAALQAARMTRVDAQRTLEFQVKQAYIQSVLARDSLDFALEVQKATTQTFELNQKRYQAGAINEADEAKVEATKLEADQAVDSATQALRVAKASLAFLLGVRGPIPDYRVEQDLPKYVVPGPLATASAESLLREAYEHRPDLKQIQAQRERAAESIRLAKRVRFPDLALQLGFNYAAPGGGAQSSNTVPPTVVVGISGNIPIFYQQQGEIQKAEADYRTQTVTRAKIEAQVSAEVEAAFTNFTADRRLVERMEARLLDRVRRTRELVALQYQKGAASLLEFLDAQRQYIATNVEYLQDLTNYWTAVYQLEQAVGVDLR